MAVDVILTLHCALVLLDKKTLPKKLSNTQNIMIGTIVTPPFNYEEWGWFFEIYLKKGEGADFSHKKDGIVKIGCFFIEEGGVSHIFLRVFGVCVCVCVCVFFSLFIPFLLACFVFHRKSLVLLNQINRHMTSTSE